MKNKLFVLILIFAMLFIVVIPTCSNASQDIIVMLDPGHGGDDPGAVAGGVIEKNVTWKIATKVKEILDNTPGIKGILTRSENTNPSLKDRGIKARDNDADLLVSFHINSSNYTNSTRGAEVYITGNTNLPKYYQNSKKLGESILSNLRSIGLPSRSYTPLIRWSTDGELYDDGFLSDYYGIIRNPMYYGIPGVLIEHCYINNTADRTQFLSSDDKIYAMAEQDAKAIIENKDLFSNTYNGEINTDLKTMTISDNSAGKKYIHGNILIAEWINGVANVPKNLPKMTLKSTDGTYSADMYVKHESGLNYYYDRVISNLDTSKEYYIEVSLTSKKNISTKKVQTAKLPNKVIGKFNNNTQLALKNDKLYFTSKSYSGEINTDLQTMNLSKNTANREYIYGEILIAEWINGVANVPNGLPEMTLKSTDGTYSAGMYVKQLDGLKYYYDRVVYNLDTNKEYYIEVKLTNKNNTSTKKIQNANINVKNKTIGKLNGKSMNIANNKITFKGIEYKGEINTDLKTMKLAKNEVGREYISGEILIAEWINGVANVPNGLPEMTLKSTDGTYSAGMYVKQLDGLKYYYDRVVFNLDTNKEYYIEVKLTNKNNTSNKKVQKANINVKNANIGTLKDEPFTIKDNTIIIGKTTKAVTLNSNEQLNTPVDLKTNETTKPSSSKNNANEETKDLNENTKQKTNAPSNDSTKQKTNEPSKDSTKQETNASSNDSTKKETNVSSSDSTKQETNASSIDSTKKTTNNSRDNAKKETKNLNENTVQEENTSLNENTK